jgi:multimeric flavodoxin WrbA
MKVTAVVGSYRKKGFIDTVVDEILSSAGEEGAEVSKVYLIDRHIEFCRNCRSCTQEKGRERGKCPSDDDMKNILDEIEGSDAIVLGSPMNFGTVTAVTKRFIERLLCFAYWPWGALSPKARNKGKNRNAVVVVSAAAPSVILRFQRGIVSLLKNAAGLLGARTIGVIYVGLAAKGQSQEIKEETRRKARNLGKRLVFGKSARPTAHSAA